MAAPAAGGGSETEEERQKKRKIEVAFRPSPQRFACRVRCAARGGLLALDMACGVHRRIFREYAGPLAVVGSPREANASRHVVLSSFRRAPADVRVGRGRGSTGLSLL